MAVVTRRGHMNTISGAILIQAGLIGVGLTELSDRPYLELVSMGVFLFGLVLLIHGLFAGNRKRKQEASAEEAQ
jgi:hypothetical protein